MFNFTDARDALCSGAAAHALTREAREPNSSNLHQLYQNTYYYNDEEAHIRIECAECARLLLGACFPYVNSFKTNQL